MNCWSSFHSSKYSRLTDERQQTAVRSAEVGRKISVQRFEPLILRPFSANHEGSARFAVSVKTRYGSPVCMRISSMRCQRSRAETVVTTLPDAGSTKGHVSS